MPILAKYYDLPLLATYSGDPATTRTSATTPTGEQVVFDLIQSLPKKGRWRHVVRGQWTGVADAITGVRPSVTATITMDHPDNMLPQKVSDVVAGFLGALTGNLDEIASGQQ